MKKWKGSIGFLNAQSVYTKLAILIFILNKLLYPWVVENVEITQGRIPSHGPEPLSLAVDSRGNPHIVYNLYASSPSSRIFLKYAYKDSLGWNIEVIDSGIYESSPGFAVITVDKNDCIHIAYHKGWFLYYLYKDSTGWHKEEKIDSVINPSGGSGDVSLETDNFGNPHIIFTGTEPDGWSYRYYAYKRDGIWYFDRIDNTPSAGLEIGFVSLRLNRAGLPRFSHHTAGSGRLVYSYMHKSGEWFHQVFDSFPRVYGWEPTALALDSKDRPHIVYGYVGNIFWLLAYVYFDGVSWHIDTSLPPDGEKWIGSTRAIAIDSLDRPHIIYQGSSLKGIDYVYFTGTEWKHICVDAYEVDTSYGIPGSLVIDKNGISHFVGVAYAGEYDILRYIYGDPTEIEEKIHILPFNFSFFVYPTLFSDKIFLIVPSHFKNSVLDIDLYDVSGKIIFSSKEFTGKKILLGGSKISPGVYFLTVRKNKEIKKFCINKKL